jgi:hypothetical protein
LDSPDAAGVVPERAARDAELGRTIRAFRIIGTVGRRLSGIKLPHVFYAWRETTHERRSAKARDAKGTWQLVFALFAEKNARNDDDAKNDANDDDDAAEEKDAFVSKYYWLWRQWETRRRRRRRALGLGPSDAECTRLVADALESNPATAGAETRRPRLARRGVDDRTSPRTKPRRRRRGIRRASIRDVRARRCRVARGHCDGRHDVRRAERPVRRVHDPRGHKRVRV